MYKLFTFYFFLPVGTWFVNKMLRFWLGYFSLSFISIHSLLAERDSCKSKGDKPDDSLLNCFKMRQNLLLNLRGQEKVKNKKKIFFFV